MSRCPSHFWLQSPTCYGAAADHCRSAGHRLNASQDAVGFAPPRRDPMMRRFLLLLLFHAACGSAPADDAIVIEFEDETSQTNNIEVSTLLTGAELYAANCETCHGLEAAGGDIWKGSIRGLKDIAPIVRDGRGTMAAVPLTDDEVDRVQHYLDSFGVVQAELSGREIFENRCATCHGARGEGTALSFPTTFMDRGLAGWVLRNGRDTQRYAGPMPSYTTDEISDEQLEEMVDFMWAQPLPGDGAGLYMAFCGNCHGEGGRGGYSGFLAVGRNPRTIVRTGHGGDDYGARHDYMPMFSTTQISDIQLESIATYLGSP